VPVHIVYDALNEDARKRACSSGSGEVRLVDQLIQTGMKNTPALPICDVFLLHDIKKKKKRKIWSPCDQKRVLTAHQTHPTFSRERMRRVARLVHSHRMSRLPSPALPWCVPCWQSCASRPRCPPASVHIRKRRTQSSPHLPRGRLQGDVDRDCTPIVRASLALELRDVSPGACDNGGDINPL